MPGRIPWTVTAESPGHSGDQRPNPHPAGQPTRQAPADPPCETATAPPKPQRTGPPVRHRSTPSADAPAHRCRRGKRPDRTASSCIASRTQTSGRTADGTGASPAPNPDTSRPPHHVQSTAPSNNISERGVRPTRTQQNISGRLTSEDATQDRLDIRSYIDTARRPRPRPRSRSARAHPSAPRPGPRWSAPPSISGTAPSRSQSTMPPASDGGDDRP